MMNNDRGRGAAGPKKTFTPTSPYFCVSPGQMAPPSAPLVAPDRCADPVVKRFQAQDKPTTVENPTGWTK
jgi:hypothetical protein